MAEPRPTEKLTGSDRLPFFVPKSGCFFERGYKRGYREGLHFWREREMEIRGQSIIEQAPRSLVITSTEIMEALQGPLSSIIDAVAMALNNAPPELSADISNRGMTITGGGALLRNIDKVLNMRTKVPVTIADEPLTCVARGGGAALEMAEKGIVLFD